METADRRRGTSIFDDTREEEETQATTAAIADVRAGRLISHEAMKRWLLSWGTDHELPPPACDQ
jgi:predicted transcriptional regulator